MLDKQDQSSMLCLPILAPCMLPLCLVVDQASTRYWNQSNNSIHINSCFPERKKKTPAGRHTISLRHVNWLDITSDVQMRQCTNKTSWPPSTPLILACLANADFLCRTFSPSHKNIIHIHLICIFLRDLKLKETKDRFQQWHTKHTKTKTPPKFNFSMSCECIFLMETL